MSPWGLTATFIGGLGLFLLGMRMMTDGLKVAAGAMLRDMLAKWTRTRPRALVAGILITTMVQSSSAVTVATLGFVNAGLLDLTQALWVVYGANVGTTATAWIVAGTGFSLDLKALSLPIIGLGMVLRLAGGTSRRGALGEALAGLGLFFLGLKELTESFSALGDSTDIFSALSIGGGIVEILIFVVAGTLFTAIVQSSTASLAIIITAAVSGIVPFTAAGALVVGANIGNSGTALLATLGATPAARRTAVGHVAFNLITAVVIVPFLPWALGAVEEALRLAGQDAAPGMTLAAFHTTFAVTGVFLVWPLSDRLVRFLEGRFRTAEESKGVPAYLDANVLAVPDVAVSALALEMARAGRHAGEIVALAFEEGRPDRARVEDRIQSFERLLEAIGTVMTDLDRSALSPTSASGLATLLGTSRHYLTVVEEAAQIAEMRDAALAEGAASALFEGELGQAMRAHVGHSNPERPDFDLDEAQRSLGVVGERYERERAALRESTARGETPARAAMTGYQMLSEAYRAMQHLVAAAERLEPLLAVQQHVVRESRPPTT